MEIQTIVKEICPMTTQGCMKNGTLLIEVFEKYDEDPLSYYVPKIIRTVVPLANHLYGKVKSKQHGFVRWLQHEFPTKGDINTLTYNDTCCSIPSYY